MKKRPKSTTRIPMLDVREGQPRFRDDELASEEPMEVRVVAWEAGRWVPHQIAVTMRTPGYDFDLAVGFLLTEGVIKDPQDIAHITYCTDPIAYCTSADESRKYNIVTVYLRRDVAFDADRLSRHVYTSSSCGVCGKASLDMVRAVCPERPLGTFRLSCEYILSLPDTLRREQALFDRTGGLHASALFDAEGRLRLLREDVGRHNALDKLIGALLMEHRLPASNAVVLVSGRASFELVQKALMAGIPIMAAVGAPSSLAVELAQEFGMTLIGFLRQGRFNLYTCPERIDVNAAVPA